MERLRKEASVSIPWGNTKQRMYHFLENRDDPRYGGVGGEVFHWLAKYGVVNHEHCERIWNGSTHDVKAVEKGGEGINAHGGFQAMLATFYVMMNFSPLRSTTDYFFYKSYFREIIDIAWNGVGEWRV